MDVKGAGAVFLNFAKVLHEESEIAMKLNEFFEYGANFKHLDINLRTDIARQKYHDTWIGRYKSAMDSWTTYDVAIWSVRCRQSLKLCFSSAYFAIEADRARHDQVFASAYYLAYYSVLHAMWAVLYLHPGESLERVTEITHSKIAKFFHSWFSQSTDAIIKYNSRDLAENLRFMREYYSYRMPLNYPFGETGGNFNPDKYSHRGFVKQCIQLSNLHSHMLRKSAEKHSRINPGVKFPFLQEEHFNSDFFKINGKEHPDGVTKILDPADRTALFEYKSLGCELVPHSNAYDHFFDEYMTYVEGYVAAPKGEIIQETQRFVYSAL
jgi:hypothetical protein